MIRWILFAIVMFATPAQAAWKHVDLAADVSLRAVAVTDAARFHVSGSKGTHAVTDDGGKTWRQAANRRARKRSTSEVSPPSTRRPPS